MAKQYKVLVLESEVRPEYLKKLDKIHKESIIRIGNVSEFKVKYGVKTQDTIIGTLRRNSD